MGSDWTYSRITDRTYRKQQYRTVQDLDILPAFCVGISTSKPSQPWLRHQNTAGCYALRWARCEPGPVQQTST